jgi:hypothetical protein
MIIFVAPILRALASTAALEICQLAIPSQLGNIIIPVFFLSNIGEEGYNLIALFELLGGCKSVVPWDDVYLF